MIRRRSAGFVLVMTMFTLLVLTMVVSGYYAQTAESLVSSKLIAGSHVALANARLGLQQGILTMRQAPPITYDQITQTVPTFSLPDMTDVIPSTGIDGSGLGFRSTMVDNGTGASLQNGGGLQYQWVVYRSPADVSAVDSSGAPARRLRIRSIGYYGSSLTSRLLLTSVVEAEIDIGLSVPTTYTRPEGYSE